MSKCAASTVRKRKKNLPYYFVPSNPLAYIDVDDLLEEVNRHVLEVPKPARAFGSLV